MRTPRCCAPPPASRQFSPGRRPARRWTEPSRAGCLPPYGGGSSRTRSLSFDSTCTTRLIMLGGWVARLALDEVERQGQALPLPLAVEAAFLDDDQAGVQLGIQEAQKIPR